VSNEHKRPLHLPVLPGCQCISLGHYIRFSLNLRTACQHERQQAKHSTWQPNGNARQLKTISVPTSMTDRFDYIVIGAGSAGCVLANRLSADGTTTVALLEAGGRDWNPWIHIPVGYFKTIHNPATDWCYVTEPDPGLNGRSLKWPRGKVLGGSSSINGLLYVRGQHQDYDRWSSEFGCQGWAYNDVLPYFRKSQNQSRGENQFHGIDGPLHVSDMSFKRPICDYFIQAVHELGTPINNDINGCEQDGTGYFQLTAHRGRRCSSATAYLNAIRSRPNLHIITQAMVKRIRFDRQRATSIECLLRDTPRTIAALWYRPW
jgi:choline dehydrogenase